MIKKLDPVVQAYMDLSSPSPYNDKKNEGKNVTSGDCFDKMFKEEINRLRGQTTSESTIHNAKNRYFHVTLKDSVPGILEYGLLPVIGPRSKEIGETAAAIYMFPNIEEMETALSNWLGECFDDDEELVILQIDLPDRFPVCREVDSNGDDFYEVISKIDIPEEYITCIYSEEYIPIPRNQFV